MLAVTRCVLPLMAVRSAPRISITVLSLPNGLQSAIARGVLASVRPLSKGDENVTIILALSWWILVAPKNGDIQDLKQPYMMGPYPSQALCRLAGLHAMPDEMRFKTPAEASAYKAEKAAAAKKYAQESAAKETAFEKAPRNTQGWAYIGTEGRHFNSNGVVDGGSSSGDFWLSHNSYPPIALTGCVSLAE